MHFHPPLSPTHCHQPLWNSGMRPRGRAPLDTDLNKFPPPHPFHLTSRVSLEFVLLPSIPNAICSCSGHYFSPGLLPPNWLPVSTITPFWSIIHTPAKVIFPKCKSDHISLLKLFTDTLLLVLNPSSLAPHAKHFKIWSLP